VQGGGRLQNGSGQGISRSLFGKVMSARRSTRSAFAVPDKPIVVTKSKKDKQAIFFIKVFLSSKFRGFICFPEGLR
jgi:hypothetical protein